MKQKDIGEKPYFKERKPGHPGHGSTEFCQVVAPAGLLKNMDQSSHQIDPPGRV